MINVFVDARSACLDRLTGWERYASSLLRELKDDSTTTWNLWQPTRGTVSSASARVKQDLWDVPRRCRFSDVLFFPTYPPAREYPAPTLWTLHDLTWLRHPEWASPLGRTYYRRLAARRLSGSTHVVTVSDAVRAELLDAGLATDRVTRVYPGLSSHLVELGSVSPPPLDRPFVLCVGTAEPRKNLGTLARAWSTSDLRIRYDLVLVGRLGWAELPAGIRHVDRPGDEELARLYRTASALVLPSLYEGFGLPLVEALQFGLPVACSDIPVFREVTDGHAHFFDPLDEADMVKAIGAAIGDGRQAPPHDVLARYRWQSAAGELGDLVARLCG
ncbi:hypothetical protein GCM10027261_18990 [Geodermatophilus arenarius]|uniref:Glycosyltransferase family 4 protein n=1 Tax=Geodermatophilus arenarius TaxID=1137990 RepID=A0ABV9LI03_9ACTN